MLHLGEHKDVGLLSLTWPPKPGHEMGSDTFSAAAWDTAARASKKEDFCEGRLSGYLGRSNALITSPYGNPQRRDKTMPPRPICARTQADVVGVPPVFRGLEGEEGGCDVLRCRQCSGDWEGGGGQEGLLGLISFASIMFPYVCG